MTVVAMTSERGSEDRLVAALRDFAARPLEQARALPAAAYTSERVLAAEIETIFKREWICAGRAEAFAKPGDYSAFQIGEVPLMVLRDKEGRLRAFSNVCLHRMSTLLVPQHHQRHIADLKRAIVAWLGEGLGPPRADPLALEDAFDLGRQHALAGVGRGRHGAGLLQRLRGEVAQGRDQGIARAAFRCHRYNAHA